MLVQVAESFLQKRGVTNFNWVCFLKCGLIDTSMLCVYLMQWVLSNGQRLLHSVFFLQAQLNTAVKLFCYCYS